MRSFIKGFMIIALTLVLSACAFTDGEPWGYVDTNVSVDEVAGTQDISIASQSTRLDVIRLYRAGSSGGVVDFDPANPPPGYTLCHGDHCHADSGELVSYDEIIAGGGAAAGPALAGARRLDALVEGAREASTRVKINERGTLSEGEVEIGTFQITGTLERSDGQYPLTISLPVAGLRVTGSVFLSIERDTPHHQELSLRLTLPEDLLDGIDVETLRVSSTDTILITNTSNPTTAALLATRLRDEGRLVMVE